MPQEKTPDIGNPAEPEATETTPLVPDDFPLPPPPRTASFWLEPLGERHNEAD
jgi:hypothetical protein